jgi:N6-adenosine-specific RNA methylase IME4
MTPRHVPTTTRRSPLASPANGVDLSVFGDGDTYSLIVADVPWPYSAGGTAGCIEYPGVTVPNLCAMDVARLARPNCALLMWTTCAMLPECLQVANAWGFEFVTQLFTWIKVYPRSGAPVCGLGSYTRQCIEPVLLFRRGKISHLVENRAVNALLREVEPCPRAAPSDSLVFEAVRAGHSVKPDAFYTAVRQLFGDLPVAELFSRETRPWLSCFGNQLTGDLTGLVEGAGGTGAQLVPSRTLSEQRAVADYKDHVVSGARSDVRREKVVSNRAIRAAGGTVGRKRKQKDGSTA